MSCPLNVPHSSAFYASIKNILRNVTENLTSLIQMEASSAGSQLSKQLGWYASPFQTQLSLAGLTEPSAPSGPR